MCVSRCLQTVRWVRILALVIQLPVKDLAKVLSKNLSSTFLRSMRTTTSFLLLIPHPVWIWVTSLAALMAEASL